MEEDFSGSPPDNKEAEGINKKVGRLGMVQNNIWRKCADLTEKALQVTSGLNLPRGNYRLAVVTVFLTQANELLYSIKLLLGKNCLDSPVILTRSLFEMAVNLIYISKDINKRLNQYLKHGGIPLTSDETKQLKQDLEHGDSQYAINFIPKRGWKNLKDMCCDLGSNWLKEYETFYRYASIPTHAGSFTLGMNYKQLLDQQLPSEHQKAEVLITALEFHLRIVTIAADVFPQYIDSEIIQDIRTKCQKLGSFLAKG